jgi:hypothetical protein
MFILGCEHSMNHLCFMAWRSLQAQDRKFGAMWRMFMSLVLHETICSSL